NCAMAEVRLPRNYTLRFLLAVLGFVAAFFLAGFGSSASAAISSPREIASGCEVSMPASLGSFCFSVSTGSNRSPIFSTRSRTRFGLVVAGRSMQRHVHLQALRPGSLRKTLQPEMREDIAQPDSHPAALDNRRRRPGIEIEHDHLRTINIFRQR